LVFLLVADLDPAMVDWMVGCLGYVSVALKVAMKVAWMVALKDHQLVGK
jgi:hypothetical protein